LVFFSLIHAFSKFKLIKTNKTHMQSEQYTVRSQNNGAFSKVNKKSISHLTRVKRTQSAAATVQVSHAPPAVLNRAQNSRCAVITDRDTSKRSTQKAFSCCDAILKTDPATRSKQDKRTAHSV
jgi:hypothetical protein